jgi:Mg/Co/Ni transporter MgtE
MIKLNQLKNKEEYTYYLHQALKEGKKEPFRIDFLNLHPADQTHFFMGLDEIKRHRVYSILSSSEFGEILVS